MQNVARCVHAQGAETNWERAPFLFPAGAHRHSSWAGQWRDKQPLLALRLECEGALYGLSVKELMGWQVTHCHCQWRDEQHLLFYSVRCEGAHGLASHSLFDLEKECCNDNLYNNNLDIETSSPCLTTTCVSVKELMGWQVTHCLNLKLYEH